MRGILMGLSVVVCLSFASARVNAQDDDEHRFEVGGLYTVIQLTDFQSRIFPTTGVGNNVVSGLGGRFAYNLTKHLAIDSEVTFFPEAHLLNEEVGEKMQGFVGVKAGIRKHRVGVFAKARPGVMWFGEFPSRGSCSSTGLGTICGVAHEKDFALDVGGVFEFYPADRLIVRADVGDTIIRYPQRVFATFPTPITVNGGWKNNLQLSVGVGWRF